MPDAYVPGEGLERGGEMMNLYSCRWREGEWHCLVVAETAKAAKLTWWRSKPEEREWNGFIDSGIC